MKLLYQWLIVIALALTVYALHLYGGSGCSKESPTRPYIPALKIVVQRRSSLSCETQENSVPKVPATPPSKSTSQKRRERRKIAKIRKLTGDTDWDFCEVKMVQ